MAVSFTIKTITPGRGSAAKKFSNDKLASKEIKQEIEYIAGKTIVDVAKRAFEITNQRKLYTAAMFFQWVVSRTPLDEEYERNSGGVHKPDNDVVRDDWYISCDNTKFRSKDFEGCFDTFNDKSAIEKIASTLQQGISTNKTVKTIRVYNTNPRFSQLEYGEYEISSQGISEGPSGRKHGVVGGFSVQAPKGMLRLTEAEFDRIVNQTKKSKGIISRIKKFFNRNKDKETVPDKSKTKSIFNKLKNKKKIKESDIGWLK